MGGMNRASGNSLGGLPGVTVGSTNSFRAGSKVRRLAPVTLCTFVPTAGTVAVNDPVNLMLTGLNQDLVALIGVGIIASNPSLPMLPMGYPSNVGNVQLIPRMGIAGGNLYMRPVFQDPTATDNANHPLPQNYPFGWTFEPGGADACLIQVVTNAANFSVTGIAGSLVVCVNVAYVGQSLNIEGADMAAIEYMLGQVNLSTYDPAIIHTAN